MEKETHTNRGRGRIWYLLSLSPSLFPLGRWSSVFWVFRLGLLDLSLEVCSSPRTWPGCRLGGPWVSFIPKGVLLRVHKPLLRVCLCKCTHDQCVGAVFPPSPSPELVAAVRPSPLSEGTLSSNVCDSLCPSPHPLTVPCLVPGRPEAHSLASASPPRVCVASAARAPLLATPMALALPLTLLLVELKA